MAAISGSILSEHPRYHYFNCVKLTHSLDNLGLCGISKQLRYSHKRCQLPTRVNISFAKDHDLALGGTWEWWDMWAKTSHSGWQQAAGIQLHVPSNREPPQDRYLVIVVVRIERPTTPRSTTKVLSFRRGTEKMRRCTQRRRCGEPRVSLRNTALHPSRMWLKGFLLLLKGICPRRRKELAMCCSVAPIHMHMACYVKLVSAFSPLVLLLSG
ncbi:hypothetical protein B0H65DRAFT_562008 [Neurospora tetraspora]|uniref:Uncharacterized protein n=1 Tax=Neurospora tetraspora TaxID=94610 RepID=A0AAE0JNM4_9PEZI|nr:hypothetical protein B0H65DRAFT_562008 [Neurospora tetraspora]